MGSVIHFLPGKRNEHLSLIVGKIYCILFSLLPLIDSMNGILNQGGNTEGSISLGILYRTMVIVVAILIIMMNGMELSRIWIIPAFIAVLFLPHLNDILLNTSPRTDIGFRAVWMKTVMPFICIEAFYIISSWKKSAQIAKRVFNFWSVVFPLVILIPYCMGVGFSTYSESNAGYKAFFYSQNDLAFVLILLYMYSWNEIRKGLSPQNIAASIMLAGCLVLLGLKSGYFFAIAVPIITIFFLQWKDRRWRLAALTFAILASVLLITQFSGVLKEIWVRWVWFSQRLGNFWTFISSGRLDRIPDALEYMLQSEETSLWMVFGSGYRYLPALKGWPFIEMDPFDLFFVFGILGVLVYVIYFGSLFQNERKRGELDAFVYEAGISSVIISTVAGHVFFNSAMSAMVISVYALYIFEAEKKVGHTDDRMKKGKKDDAKQYIFLSHCMSGVGGGQRYIQAKAKWLLQEGWNVVVFHVADGKLKMNFPKEILIVEVPNLVSMPASQTNRALKFALNSMVNNVQTPNAETLVVESLSCKLGMWGELLANKLDGTNFIYLIDEETDVDTSSARSFLKEKLSRHEVACINPRILSKAIFGSESGKEDFEEYILPAWMGESPVKDIPFEGNGTVSEYSIALIGRLDKSYNDDAFNEVGRFCQKHAERSFRIWIVGDTENDVRRKKLISKLDDLDNVTLRMMGYMFPIPKELITGCDAVIAKAGSATACATTGVKVICYQHEADNVAGVIGFDIPKSTSLPNSKLNLCAVLEELFFGTAYLEENRKFELPRIQEPDYRKHLEYVVRQVEYENVLQIRPSKRDRCKGLWVSLFGNVNYRKILRTLRK